MRKSWLIILLLVFPTAGNAADINDFSSFSNNQPLFKDLTNDLGAALSYKAITPAEPLEGLGFDIGFEVSSTKMETTALATATNSSSTALLIPKLHVHKGLPLGFDIGAFTSIASDNIGLFGAELRYAIYEGGTLSPAVSIRYTYSKLSGIDELDLNTQGLELSISKGFAMFTPYAGVGTILIDNDTSITGLEGESLTKNKYFLGFNFNLGLMNIAAETEKTGENATTSAKIGVRF